MNSAIINLCIELYFKYALDMITIEQYNEAMETIRKAEYILGEY